MQPADQVVLITGYPGLQARKLTQWVLSAEPASRVVLVILEALRERAVRFIDQLEPALRDRIDILLGDAAAIDLGLSGAEYRELATRVTRIHHVAHVSYVGVDADTAAYTNIQGAVEAVELARSAERLSCLVHHSTAHVSGDRRGVVSEDELGQGQGFHSVVQETRMKAELVVRRAMDDVPIAVVRPTMMVGDSGTGEAERFDGPYLLVMLILGLPGDMAVPLPTGSDNPLNIVPVDYVVKAAHAIGRDPYGPGRTFHLASPENLTAQQVFDLIARAGGRRTTRSFIPSQVANALFRTPGVERLLHEPRALMQQLATRARYDTRHARKILAGTRIICPPISSYVDTWITAVQEHLKQRRNEQELASEIDDPLYE